MSPPVEVAAGELDLAPWVRPGDGIVVAEASAEPAPLLDALVAQAAALGGVRAFVGLSLREDLDADGLEVVSYGGLGRVGRLERLRVVPCHYSAIPRLLADGRLPGDVAFVQVAPPGPDGRCSFGVGASYVADAVAHARVVVAEVNARCPPTPGAAIAWEDIDVAVHSDRPLVEIPSGRPGEVERAIADHVAALVRDGDTIQLGVGALPDAILAALRGHTDLAVHSGMITDGVLDLMEAGVVTGARKPSDPGLVVTPAGLGTARLFDAMGARGDILLRPASHTHDAVVLAGVGRLVSINAALEVDGAGQVGAEVVAGRRLGCVGGQVDFLRAAARSGGAGIVALPAARLGEALHGPVTTARADVDWVVTEHGARRLGGLDETARATALRELAGG